MTTSIIRPLFQCPFLQFCDSFFLKIKTCPLLRSLLSSPTGGLNREVSLYFASDEYCVYTNITKPRVKIHNSGVHEWIIFLSFTDKNKFSFWFYAFSKQFVWIWQKNCMKWRQKRLCMTLRHDVICPNLNLFSKYSEYCAFGYQH